MLQEIEIRKESLSNGAVLLANENDMTRSVAFVGSVKAGSMNDEKGKFGTAEIVSRLLNRGTSKASSSELSRRIEEIGATLQFSNNDESVSFSGRCHSESLRSVLEIISDCLSKPSFPKEEIEKARAEVISDLEAERDETRTSAYRGLVSLVYGRTKAYGRNSLGTIEDVLTVTREDIASFHEHFYTPASLIFSITGSFGYSQLLSDVEETVGAWNGGTTNNLKDLDFSSDASEPFSTIIPMAHKSQVDLALGEIAVPRGSPDYYALNLGNLILGRIGLYGRLGKNVREEKGLAYYCYSALQSKSFSGHLGIYAGVNPKNIKKAIDGIMEEVRRITNEPLSHEEISRGRRNLKGSLSIALESSYERAGIIHEIEYYGLGLDYISRYPSILDEVIPEKVLNLFERYLSSEKLHVVAAGPLSQEFPPFAL